MNRTMKKLTIALAALVIAAAFAPAAFANGGRSNACDDPKILLTNDDGFDSAGIQAMRDALVGANYDVTIVAPLDNQSGAGGSLSTDVGGFVNVIEEEPGVWSVDSTPSDAVRAGLGAVLAGDPPDLIISGSNAGQNLGQPGSNASGTIGAALQGLFSNIPSIAVSVGFDFAEAGIGFPSTLAAFPPTADFTVRVIQALEDRCRKGRLLPERTLLNINVPVPYEDIENVKFTRLAESGDLEFVWQDVLGVIPNGGGPVLINVGFPAAPDPVKKADSDAHRAGDISITLVDGDMTAQGDPQSLNSLGLGGLTP